jgi:glutamate synthase (NADPH/NADH) large chain
MLLPLVKELRDPVGSMGNDSALACLSSQSRIIYDYFKQLFAQVTNPCWQISCNNSAIFLPVLVL